MRTPSSTRARFVAIITTAALCLGGVAVLTAPAQAASPKITGFGVKWIATAGVGLTWNEIGDTGYRVRFSNSSSMSSPLTWDVVDNYHEWTRTVASPRSPASRLTPGQTYYFQVKAITRSLVSGDRTDVTGYSSVLKVTLPKTGYPEMRPVDQKATPNGSDAMYVSWRTRGPGQHYIVRYTTEPSLNVLKWKKAKFDVSGGILSGLSANKTYYVRSRAVTATGKAASDYADSTKAKTGPAGASPGLSVASYNILKVTSSPDWAGRRKAVAANILTAAPHVLGLQEAIPVTWATNGKKQYADIISLLGGKYSLVTSGAGSSGTQLAYDPNRLSVVDRGIKRLYVHGPNERYAVWALFKDKSNGKTFFALSTHLEPSTTSAAFNDARIKQAREIVDLVDSESRGRPTVIVGDMNSGRSTQPNNGPYNVFTQAGYVDPIDNTSSSWISGLSATAEHIIDGQYNSYNGLETNARRTSFPRGTHIDYLFASPDVRVAMWRIAVNVNTNGSFIGTIPSDHNLIQTWVNLP